VSPPSRPRVRTRIGPTPRHRPGTRSVSATASRADAAASLVARDLGDDGPDAERRFEFVLSHDRTLAIQVAAALLARVWPRP
jgi:hypothetical protein